MITSELTAAIRAEVRAALRDLLPTGAGAPRYNPYNIPFKNESGETVPPYAVMRPDGIALPSSEGFGNWFFKMKKPDDQFRRRYYVNGPIAIPDDGFGMCSDGSYPTLVRIVAFSGTKFVHSYGVTEGQWYLRHGRVGGFTLCGAYGSVGGTYPTDFAVFQQTEVTTLHVRPTSAFAWGTAQTCNIIDASGVTNMELSVTNLFKAGNVDDPPTVIEFTSSATVKASYQASENAWYVDWGSDITVGP